MNERIHLPPSDASISPNSPLVFLAGPIQGSPDWQTGTAEELIHHLPNAHLASPRRIAESHDEFNYDEQVLWELKHLQRARALGVISFWFAAQDHSLSHEKGRAYAQTSRVEVGRTLGWNDDEPFPFILGFDRQYSPNGGGNERYIRAMCKAAGVTVYDSLEDVIDQTILRLPIDF